MDLPFYLTEYRASHERSRKLIRLTCIQDESLMGIICPCKQHSSQGSQLLQFLMQKSRLSLLLKAYLKSHQSLSLSIKPQYLCDVVIAI